VLALSACLHPTFGYLADPGDGFALRYPRSWDEVRADPFGSEWVGAVDAASTPSAQHLQTYAVDAPFLLAQVQRLTPAEADTYTLAQLRQLAKPDHVDPTEVTDGSVRMQFNDPILTDQGFEGHHLRFDLDQDGKTVRVEHFAALSPDRATLYRVRVACLVSCFERNRADIEDVFDSIELRR
jgi:hypothetical protein